ncbi:MAG: hypothetical protein PHI84_22240, partial [Kiritimatiellae bacterium]|nr:hypothetical protein [Kiritimatiellia bacterium]
MKSQGCCPANVLTPQPPPPVTVPYCSSCDLQINTFDVLNAVVDQNGSVNFTGNISSSKLFSWKVTIGGTVIGSGTSATVKARWNLKNEKFKWGQSKKYTATLSVYPALQKNADNTFTLTYKNGSVYTFNTSGKLTAIADKNGNTVNLAYSSGGNLANINDPQGKTIYLSYDAGNRISAITDPNNNSYAFAYDSLNRRIKRTLPNDSYTIYIYDQLSRLTNITHKNAFNLFIDRFSYTYDSVGNRITTKDNQYEYDQNGNTIKKTETIQGKTKLIINRLIIVLTLSGVFCFLIIVIGSNPIRCFLNKTKMTNNGGT